ncbi:MAG TPA: ATP-binding protein [Stellaceae bacterium]|jgi:two-component system OmpR family sensor kinase|nr:ATP-binding protein [Stellaceae bacterium]
MTGFRSLRTRAWSVAALVLTLVMLLGLFSLWRLDDYQLIVSDIGERYLENTQFLGDLNNFTSDFRAAEATALLASTPVELDKNKKEIGQLDDLINLAEHSFEHVRNDAPTTVLYADFVAKWRSYRQLADQVLMLAGSGRQSDGIEIYRTTSHVAYDAASDALGVLTEHNRQAARKISDRAVRAYWQARFLTALAVVTAGLILIGSLIYMRRTILRPLLDLASRMRRLAENDMDIESDGAERGDEVGEMARAVTVFRNNAVELAVSQRALAQQASMLSEKLAHEQHLAELQRNFVSMASHEFRTPLTIIDAQAQRLINAGERLTPDDIAQRARSVRAAVARMTSVIDNLIDASRLIDGQTELYFHPSEFDLAAQIHEICLSHRELTPRARIVERLAIRPLMISGDPKLLFQVFHNLISNAVKYSPTKASVEVIAKIIGNRAVVTVADHGLGIPETDREHLFERYYRGSNVAGIVGSGIGLYLVKTAIDLHRGEISVESKEGKGSRFIVEIPTLLAAEETRDRSALAAK